MDKPKCSFEDCNRSAEAKNLCGGHYQQLWKGQDLRPLQSRGNKVCTFPQCGRAYSGRGYCNGHLKQLNRGLQLKPLNPKRAAPKLAPKSATICVIGDCAKWAVKNTCLCATHRFRARTYNIPYDTYTEMMRNCMACGSTKRLSVDHNHKCCTYKGSCGECVRGVLCTSCNTAIGLLEENVGTLNNLINYLQK